MAYSDPFKVVCLGLMMEACGEPDNNKRLLDMRSLAMDGPAEEEEPSKADYANWLAAVAQGLLNVQDLWVSYAHSCHKYNMIEGHAADQQSNMHLSNIQNRVEQCPLGNVALMPNRIVVWLLLRYRGTITDLEEPMTEIAHIEYALLAIKDTLQDIGAAQAFQTIQILSTPKPGFELPDDLLLPYYPDFISF
jgi:hypothetical protein